MIVHCDLAPCEDKYVEQNIKISDIDITDIVIDFSDLEHSRQKSLKKNFERLKRIYEECFKEKE